jgi:hypothetical protein
MLSKFPRVIWISIPSVNSAALFNAHGQFTRGDFMKKKIAWLFLVAVALLTVPVSHASAITQTGWSIDGTQPPQPPVPLPGG